MTNVARINPEHKLITAPAELRALPAWLCWRHERHDGEKKPRKVPYYSTGGRRHGRQGGHDDKSRLVTFPAAIAAAQRLGMDGVGFAPLPEWGIVALDFDRCIDADGHLPPEVNAVVKDCYSEFSPSGQGVRAFMRGDLGNRKSVARNGEWGFEIFSTAGFVTLTGNPLPHVDLLDLEDAVPPVTPAVRMLCEKRFGSATPKEVDPDDFMAGREPRHGLTVAEMQDLLDRLDPGVGRDGWIQVGMALHHETEGDDTGFDLWNEWSSSAHNYVSEEDLRTQWDSFTRRAGPGQRQITMATVFRMANEAESLSVEELRAVASQAAATQDYGPRTPDTFDGKFRAYSAAEIATRPPIEWLVKGIVPKGHDPVIIFGAPSAGKSFCATDIGCAVARGIDWHGRKVKQGRVLIVMAEGSGGAPLRLRAYARHHGIDPADLDVAVVTAAPNFLDKGDIGEIIRTIAAVGNVALVEIDTFAQVTPGANENAAEDMGPALNNARVISEVTGATVVLIHHSGKDASKGARGWSGIKGAASAQLEIIRHEDGQREIHVEKMKDGKDGDRLGFKLESVQLGFDADGDPLESLVVVPADIVVPVTEDEPRSKLVRYGKHERHVLEMIEAEHAADNDADLGKFIQCCVDAMPEPGEGRRDVRKFEVSRAIQSLARRKEALVAIRHGRIIFCA